MQYAKLEEKIGYVFKNKNLLKTALTHKSFTNENQGENNERLEFLGDAVLGLVISNHLYLSLALNEGDMSKKRAQIVCEHALFTYASKIDLSEHLIVGQGEEEIQKSLIADSFEAIIAAVYLEAGLKKATEVIEKLVIPFMNEVKTIKDYKSTLQEYVQADKRSLEYIEKDTTGPAHARQFVIEVKMDGIRMGIGKGKTKKQAEQNAAREALEKKAGKAGSYE
ncbi:MAG: ribonuclease III [Erysipelotrichales bacterium]|nr:ribonuclease III [Erysipelotrichales bacterium]